jgi:hypothetical protein
MIAAFVAGDIGTVEFGVAIFIAIVIGILVWNVVFLVFEEIKDRYVRKNPSRVNDAPAKVVVSND